MISKLLTKRPHLRQPDAVQAMSQRLATLATISTFLAAVQAQTLAIYFSDDKTGLQIATNAFTFAGIFLDVIAGFTSVLCCTMLATRAAHVTIIHALVSGCSSKYLTDALQESTTNLLNDLSPIGRWMCWQVNTFIERQTETKTKTENEEFVVVAENLIEYVNELGITIEVLIWAGNGATIAMLLGIVCFLTSAICFAFSTQPSAVRIVSAVVAVVFSLLGLLILIRILLEAIRQPPEKGLEQGLEYKLSTEPNQSPQQFKDFLIAFSPDGRHIVCRRGNGAAHVKDTVWSTESSTEPSEAVGPSTLLGGPLDRHIGRVTSVAFSSDGCYIVSGSQDQSARVWKRETGTLCYHAKHNTAITAVAFSLDGRYIISGCSDGTVHVWDTAESAEQNYRGKDHHRKHEDAFRSYGSLMDTNKGIETGDSGAHVHDSRSSGRHDVAAEGDTLTGAYRASASLMDIKRDVEPETVDSDEQTAHVYDSRSGGRQDKPLTPIQITRDGRHFSMPGFNKQDVEVTTTRDTKRITETAAPNKQTVHNGLGGYESMGAERGVENGAGNGKGGCYRHDSSVTSVAFSHDGCYIVSGSEDRSVRVWDRKKTRGEARFYMEHGDSVTSVAFSPNGQYIVSGSHDGGVYVWGAENGIKICRWKHAISVTSVAFSSDSHCIVAGFADEKSNRGTLRVWDTITQDSEQRWACEVGLFGSVISVAFSQDGSRIVSGSNGGDMRILDVRTGVEFLYGSAGVY